jgi:UDP-N-acetylglucosamine 4-epimerase
LFFFQENDRSYTWFITGVAGFIGSNLLEYLLNNNQKVIGVDNFATGNENNLNDVFNAVGEQNWKNFNFYEQDITNYAQLVDLFDGVDFVLHQAALGSVPRSFKHPLSTNEVNVSGFLNILEICRNKGISNLVYASSSSVYGDSDILPKKENLIGNPLSPYAITKNVNELYAAIYAKYHGLPTKGLRYFNVFGPRQNPNGAYAAVIPKWMNSIANNKEIHINGDGSTTRDFCYIQNVVQANLLAVQRNLISKKSEIYNIAFGESNTLIDLYELICGEFNKTHKSLNFQMRFRDFRQGDVRHSLADISSAKTYLKYSPQFDLRQGIKEYFKWFMKNSNIYD